MDKEIIIKGSAIVARQILLYFFDFHRAILPIFDKANFYRVPFRAYDKFRENDKIRFSKEFYRLKRSGFIKTYLKEKEKYIGLTKKGLKIAKKYLVDQIEIQIPSHWDREWHLVIFDIPDDKRPARDILREKLERIGFLQLQESVYVFPFDCSKEIGLLKNLYYIEQYVQYIIADRIETEIDLLEEFYDLGLLNNKN